MVDNKHGYSERSIILVTRFEYEDEEFMQSSTYEPTWRELYWKKMMLFTIVTMWFEEG